MEDLRQTAAFVATAEALHLGRAARGLGIHPATLAARLRALEARLGLVLVDRSHRCRIALTQAGTALLPVARSAVAAMAELEGCAADVRRGTRGVVRVALTSDRSAETDEIIRALREVDDGWDVAVQRMEVADAGRAMAIGAVECAVGSGPQLPRTTPGLRDPRPNRLQRAKVVRIGPPPPGSAQRGLVVAWRESWHRGRGRSGIGGSLAEGHLADGDLTDADRADGDPADADPADGDLGCDTGGGLARRRAHAVALEAVVRRMARAAEEIWRPRVAARRREAAVRRQEIAERVRAARAECDLVAEDTARYGFAMAASRAQERERAEVLRLVAEARARGTEIGVHLLVRWLCLPDDETDGPAVE